MRSSSKLQIPRRSRNRNLANLHFPQTNCFHAKHTTKPHVPPPQTAAPPTILSLIQHRRYKANRHIDPQPCDGTKQRFELLKTVAKRCRKATNLFPFHSSFLEFLQGRAVFCFPLGASICATSHHDGGRKRWGVKRVVLRQQVLVTF